jgi:hypothetical protein
VKKLIDCSRTENYFAEKKRMIEKHRYICEVKGCADCPLHWSKNGMDISCTKLEKSYPDKAIAIIQKWSDEHPPKTYLSEFLKHYPNVKLLGDGTPKCLCPHQLGLKDINDCRKHYTCAECWNQPMPIKDGEEND